MNAEFNDHTMLDICPVMLAQVLHKDYIEPEIERVHTFLTVYLGFTDFGMEEQERRTMQVSKDECDWRVDYFASLCVEYNKRFGRPHAYEVLIGMFDERVQNLYGIIGQ